MFKPVFCDRMTWRSATELGLSELAIGSIVPASGAAGLALGAWALRKSGMPAIQIAERSVAFFTIKSAANFVAVAVLGVLMFLGLGPVALAAADDPPGSLGDPGDRVRRRAAADAARARAARAPRPKWAQFAKFVGATGEGVRQAGHVLRRGDPRVIAGSLGYWFFDNLVLWATFHAVGTTPPFTVVLMAYLIGQLGGLLPIPGGIGGIDGGLIGTFIVYGVAAAPTAAAVLAYRLILFWLPLAVGAVAFNNLRRGFNDPSRPDLCAPIPMRRILIARIWAFVAIALVMHRRARSRHGARHAQRAAVRPPRGARDVARRLHRAARLDGGVGARRGRDDPHVRGRVHGAEARRRRVPDLARHRGAAHGGRHASPPRRPVDGARGFRQGVTSNLANPKIAVLFTSLLPQFVEPGAPLLVPFLVLGRSSSR